MQIGFAITIGIKRLDGGKGLFKGQALVNYLLANAPAIGIPGTPATGIDMAQAAVDIIGLRLGVECAPGRQNFRFGGHRWGCAEEAEENKGKQKEDRRGSQAMA